jgi:hypothetical protein
MCRSLGPGRVENFLHVVQTVSGAQTPCYPMGTGGSFLGVERPGREPVLKLVSRSRKCGSVHPLPYIRLHGVELN